MKNLCTKAAFDSELGLGGKKLLLFYSGWCPFCSAFLPAFESRAAGNPERFAKVCVDDLSGLEDSFSVEVVPTVLFFKDGRLEKRLDGVLGQGLSEKKLIVFACDCGIK